MRSSDVGEGIAVDKHGFTHKEMAEETTQQAAERGNTATDMYGMPCAAVE
jgi:hypothetical protein